MYAERFGTDWTSLDHDEVVERAYALGVEAALGTVDREEYDRLVAESEDFDAYDQSLVELAYREGRSEALACKREADSSTAVWEELIDEELTTATEPEPPTPGPVTDGPPGLVARLEALDRPTLTELPPFLSRK